MEREYTHAEEMALQHTEYCGIEARELCPICRDHGEEFISLMDQGFTAAAAERILFLEDVEG